MFDAEDCEAVNVIRPLGVTIVDHKAPIHATESDLRVVQQRDSQPCVRWERGGVDCEVCAKLLLVAPKRHAAALSRQAEAPEKAGRK